MKKITINHSNVCPYMNVRSIVMKLAHDNGAGKDRIRVNTLQWFMVDVYSVWYSVCVFNSEKSVQIPEK